MLPRRHARDGNLTPSPHHGHVGTSGHTRDVPTIMLPTRSGLASCKPAYPAKTVAPIAGTTWRDVPGIATRVNT
jgi:hypothetical protein